MYRIFLILLLILPGFPGISANAPINDIFFVHKIDELATLRVIFESYYTTATGSEVRFSMDDTLDYSFEWSFGDGDTGSYPVVMHQYSAPGTYEAALTVTSLTDPSDSYTTFPPLSVTVEDSFEVPNVFTPDGDGNNDYFIVRSNGFIPLTITIFDRAGNVVYKHSSPVINWDGRTPSGTLVKPGVYYYVITSSEPLYNKTGFVHILYN